MKYAICMVFAILFVLLAQDASAQFTLERVGCSTGSQNTVCSIETRCDLNGCRDVRQYGCSICPKTEITCSDGTPASCDNTCQASALSAGCTSCVPTCTSGAAPPQRVVLQFDVYEYANIDMQITPEIKAGRAGDTLTYKATIINKNPTAATVETRIIGLPDGWTVAVTDTVTIGAQRSNTIDVSVTSPAGDPLGDNQLQLELRSSGKVVAYKDFIYRITNTYPPTVTAAPDMQSGAPGTTVEYTISVTNNYPVEAGQKTAVISIQAPDDWNAELQDAVLTLEGTETKPTTLRMTSGEGAPSGPQIIGIKAALGSDEGQTSVIYNVDVHGDGVCQPGEETAYPADCTYGKFTCAGRCETQTDAGVRFDAQIVDFPEWSLFAVCAGTRNDCASAAADGECGPDKACICTSATDSSCAVTCNNRAGVYYLYAEKSSDYITSGRFSYICPRTNIDQIQNLLLDFTNAKERYEIGKSSIDEQLVVVPENERQRYQQCSNALGTIISKVRAHIALLRSVIAAPTLVTISNALTATDTLRSEIEALEAQCRGLGIGSSVSNQGRFSVKSIDVPALTEIQKTVAATVVAENDASAATYGYVECTFSSPGGAKTPVKYPCGNLAPGEVITLRPQKTAFDSGTWSLECKAYTAPDAQCSSPTQTSSLTKTFDIYTKQISVQSVAGACTAQGVMCTITLSQPNVCADCRMSVGTAKIDCNNPQRQGNVMSLLCPTDSPSGTYELEGFVYRTDECEPADPASARTTVTCIA